MIALKGTGFKKIQIVTEDGGAVEEAENEEDEEEEQDNGRPGPRLRADDDDDEAATSRHAERDDDTAATASPDEDAPANGATPDMPASDTPASGMPASGAPDAAGLTKDLTGLVKQMLGVIKQDPTAKTALAELATDAQASLKRGDLEQAAAGIEILREAIDSYSSGSGNDGDGGTKNANRTGRAGRRRRRWEHEGALRRRQRPQRWQRPQRHQGRQRCRQWRRLGPGWRQPEGQGRRAIGADLPQVARGLDGDAGEGRQGAAEAEARRFLDASEGEEMVEGLEDQFFKVVDPVLAELDETLSETLQEAAEADGPERERLLGRTPARTIARYTNFVSSNSIISDLDNNPFVPLSIGKTLTSTLATLSSIMR